jgi:predicted transcriptional regulator
MMAKVTIPLPDDLKALAEQHAKSRGTSLEEFLRETVERRLKRLAAETTPGHEYPG